MTILFFVVTGFVFLLLLSLLVLIHEFGHFIMAKKFGIKVEEFGFGFPPRMWGVKKGETLYSINLLPIGGFVKMYGEDEVGGGKLTIDNSKLKVDKSDIDRAFFTKPASQRAVIVVAGVVMNLLLAISIYYIFLGISNFKTELPLLGKHKFFFVNQVEKTDVLVSSVSKNSPAEKVGIAPFSRITMVNGEKIVAIDQFVKAIRENKGKDITLGWTDVKTNKEYTAHLIPRVSPPRNEGALGIVYSPLDTVSLSYDTPVQRIFSGIIHPLNLLSYNLDIFGKLFGMSVKEKTAAPISQGVAGPLGIIVLVNSLVQIPDLHERILQLLNLAGILSISLAFFNVLPIPALDGGRLFFILIEMITRKKVSPQIESAAHAIGFAVLMLLIVLVTFNDISKFIPGIGK